jgi:DNA-binding MarR family transcriptional regulator
MSDIELVIRVFPRIHYACRGQRPAESAGGAGLSPHQVRILSHLDPVDPVMVGELAEYMGVTSSTMSLNLTRLQRGGFIVRARDPDDRRVMNVRLSESGVRVRDASTMLDPERVAALLGHLGADDRSVAVRGLALLAGAADALVTARLGRQDPPPGGTG